MIKNNAQVIVPRLRFPEFREAEGWAEKQLGEICDYWNGGSHEKAIAEKGDYYLISLNSIDIEGRLKPDMKRLPYTDNSLKRNDLVMVLSDVAHGNFLGLTDIIPDNYFVLNQRMAGLRLKDTSSVNIVFLRTYINYNQKYFKQRGQGSSQQNLSKSSVTDFPVFVPSLEEQQKIADCLSSLDEVIALHTRKLDALKRHKKGLMQQLFPPEGETTPKLRFPEFREAGEWEEKEIGKVFDVTRGNVLSMSLVSEAYSEESPYPVYSSQTKNNGLAGYYSEFLYENAITWTTDGANAGDTNYRPEKFYCTNVCGVLLNADGYANSCVAAMIDAVSRRHVSYVGNPKLMNGVMSKIKIPFPTLPEQQKIADCLSSLDDLIAAQTEKLNALKAHKKGLMQQLFPDLS